MAIWRMVAAQMFRRARCGGSPDPPDPSPPDVLTGKTSLMRGFAFLVRWGLDRLLSASPTWTHINGDGSALRTCHASHNEADMPNLFAGRLNLLQPSAALGLVASNDGDRAATG